MPPYNTSAPSAGQASVLPYPSFSVNSYGADPSGNLDSTAAFKAAYAAAAASLTASAAGGYVTMGAGTYKVALGAGLTASDPRIGLMGPGAGICKVNFYGSGDGFTHFAAVFDGSTNEGTRGLSVGGFTADGTGATGASNLVKIYDLNSMMVHDLKVQNITQPGSAGILFTSATGWTERLLILRVMTNNCIIGVRFAGNFAGQGGTSFDYMRCLDLYSDIFPGQIGVQADGFAQLDQATFFYSYNAKAQGAGATSTALMIGPTDGASETSRIINALLDIRGEKDGAGSLCNDIHVGSFANLTGTGVLLGSGMDAGVINSGSSYVSGWIDTPAYPANSKMFTGSNKSFSIATNLFPNPPQAKGLTLTDWQGNSSAVRSSLMGGTGNPNGGAYFSNLAGDVFVRQDSAAQPNQVLYVTAANGSNVFVPVVAAAIASGTATLVAGSVTIANTSITANSVIRTFNVTAGGTVGALSVTKVAGTSFTIHSSSGTDTSVVGYEIVSF